LWLLFLLIVITTINVPVYFEDDWKFVGIKKLLILNIIPLISFSFLILGLIFVSRFKYKLSGSMKTPFKISKIENTNYEHLTFLSTYIIPLVAFDLSKIKYAIVLLILLIAIGTIYIKTDMFYANPSLALIGYHIYKVDGTFRTGTRQGIIIISRQKVHHEQKVSYKQLSEKIYYVRVVNE
jgi:hypothetical protein